MSTRSSNSAKAAAASAALAATFDPNLFDRKSDTLSSSRLTGVIDISLMPVLPSQKQFASSGGLANLTTAQQAEIGQGSVVTTTDGYRYIYSGQGSKTVAASYTILADITPEWNSVAGKPSFFPSNITNVAGLQSALDLKSAIGHAHAWSEITGKPNLYPTDIASVSGLQAALNDKSAVGHGHSWTEITGKPTTFAPSSHSHPWTDITGFSGMEDKGTIPASADLNAYTTTGVYHQNANANAASGTNYPLADAGMLEVFNPTANMTYQRYTAYRLNRSFWRTYNSVAWTAWVEVEKVGHTHAIANVTGLQAAIDAKQNDLRNVSNFELAQNFGADASVYIDFHAARVSDPRDYNARIIRYSGANGSMEVMNVGTGNIALRSGGGIALISTGNITLDKRPSFVGNLAWDAGNFNPDSKVNRLTDALTDFNDRGAAPLGLKAIHASGATANSPPGFGSWCQGIEMGRATSRLFQMVTADGTSATLFFRKRHGTTDADWTPWWSIWNSGNFDPASKFGTQTGTWHQSVDGQNRYHFTANGRSFFGSPNGYEWRSSTDGALAMLNNTGELTIVGQMVISNVGPTLHLRDTDHRSAMIHVNSNTFHILRGTGVGAAGWEMTRGAWPMTINLENNDAFFGGEVYGATNAWFRVRGTGTGIYWEHWTGGWFMTDSAWMRSYNDKGIVTGGTMQMGAFTVTSDRRLKSDIVAIPQTEAARIIDETNVYEFTKGGRRMFGMIAQEAREIAPILVSHSADLHPEDGDAILSLDQTGYIPLLIAEVRSLRQRVSTLERSAA